MLSEDKLFDKILLFINKFKCYQKTNNNCLIKDRETFFKIVYHFIISKIEKHNCIFMLLKWKAELYLKSVD